MSRRVIQLPVVFDGANRRKDRSLSLRLSTMQEVSNPEFAEIDKVVGRPGYLLFSENEFSEADIPLADAPTERGDKTPSQRLRAILYRVWEKEGKRGDYDLWYRAEMSRIMDAYKTELDT
jgi:hypothetical protein